MNYSYKNHTNTGGCDTCKNKTICMFVDEFQELSKSASELAKNMKKPLSPIKVSVTCGKYEKRAEKQEGFYIK